MANEQRRGGLITLKVDGEVQDAKGAFDCSFGTPKREGIVGQDRGHGYKELPQLASVEGTITDRRTLDVKKLTTGEGLTITVDLANGKTFVLHNAYYAGDPMVNTEEGEIKVKWESAEEGEEV